MLILRNIRLWMLSVSVLFIGLCFIVLRKVESGKVVLKFLRLLVFLCCERSESDMSNGLND